MSQSEDYRVLVPPDLMKKLIEFYTAYASMSAKSPKADSRYRGIFLDLLMRLHEAIERKNEEDVN